ncbi:hypothetical protein JOD14_002406 [Enterococcus lemanii]|nr:hypothetical protein [Enterococcus lemanii]
MNQEKYITWTGRLTDPAVALLKKKEKSSFVRLKLAILLP